MASSNIPKLSTVDGSSYLSVPEPFAAPKSTIPPPIDRSTKPRRPRQPRRQYHDSPFTDSVSQSEKSPTSETASSIPSQTSLDSSIRLGKQLQNDRPRSTTSRSSSAEAMAILPIGPQAPSTRYRTLTDFEGLQPREDPSSAPTTAPHDMASLVTKVDVRPRYDPEVELKMAGKGRVGREKIYVTSALVAVNALFIFATWWWPKYYYVYLPFITITVFLNAVMVCSVIIFSIKHRIFPEKKLTPEQRETLVYIVPCYNETPEELTRSLDSLANQTNIDQHPHAIMIICDGKVRGPGMEKSSAEYLLDDILVERRYRRYIRGAYRGWTHESLDVEVQAGAYRGVPYYCIIKQQNQGKRDSLIALRSFLYNFNIRAERPEVVYSTEFFGEMASFLIEDCAMQYVTYLVGMDGDTVFGDTCVSELLKEARYPNTVGVCGYVAVDFTRGRFGHWSPWNLYQSAEYTISQGLRRFHQSIVTNKVSCLPGCCQLLRICETTCGNRILFDLFGYCPKPTDSMLKHIRATASEDRNHVCLMLSAFPKAQTRQALRAKAYTDVPHSWPVFLSQRRRWTLGATSNDLFLVTAPGIQWFERILALANCVVWFMNIFVFASIACLVVAILNVEGWIILCFSAIMIIPVLYYFCLVLWIPQTFREKLQYLIGLLIYIVCGPFLNIFVLFYALWNMDSFGWGKTRRVVSDPNNEKAVPITADEEAEVGMRPSRSKTLKHDTVAVLGFSEAYATLLAKAFGKHYRTIAYDPSEEILARVRAQFSGAENYSIKTTSDQEQLMYANIFLIAAPPESERERASRSLSQAPLHLRDAAELVFRHAQPGHTVMIESTVAVGTTRFLIEDLERRGIFCGYASSSPPNSLKRISALSERSLRQVMTIYQRVFAQTASATSTEAAEMYHLLEIAHRQSQAMLTNDLEGPQNGDRLQDNLRRISGMWKQFAEAADQGVERTGPVSEKNSGSNSF